VLYEVRLSGVLSFAESHNGCKESHIEYIEYIKCNACIIAVVSDHCQKCNVSVNITYLLTYLLHGAESFLRS